MATEIKSWNPLAHIQSPLRWRTPKWVRIEADLFRPCVREQDIDRVLAVVALCPQLNFIMPTEHTERMAAYFATGDERRSDVCDAMNRLEELRRGPMDGDMHGWGEPSPWPLPNLMPGAIVEDQATANARIPHLLECPAKLRMVDARLRGGLELPLPRYDPAKLRLFDGFNWIDEVDAMREPYMTIDKWLASRSGINFVTCRGTTEPMHPDWVRALRDQSAGVGVPFRFEGWGDYVPWDRRHTTTEQADAITASGKLELHTRMMPDGSFPKGECTREEMDRYMSVGVHMVRVGPELSGRLLDGVEHDAMPEVGHD